MIIEELLITLHHYQNKYIFFPLYYLCASVRNKFFSTISGQSRPYIVFLFLFLILIDGKINLLRTFHTPHPALHTKF